MYYRINLESILEKERKQRKRYFGKPEMNQQYFELSRKIEDSLIGISTYFKNWKTVFRNYSLVNPEKEILENNGFFEVLKPHFKFMKQNHYDWFYDKDKFQKLYFYVKNARKEGHNVRVDDFEKCFRISEKNALRILQIVYKKGIEAINMPIFNSPETIRFFDCFYYALKHNKGAKYFLCSYFEEK